MAPRVYLLDHAVYKPPEEYKVVAKEVEEKAKDWPMYSEAVKDFMWKIFVKSGIGADTTYLPPFIHPCHTKEPNSNMATALLEAEMVMGGVFGDLLAKTGLQPKDVDILVTCCSIFCPTPSLASMLVNKFSLRPDVQSYHLGGMGCGTGVVGVNLCRDLLAAHPNSVLVFVPAEITTLAFYHGKEKHRMVANAIFRMGGAAIAMTNKPSLKHRAKYELVTATRVHNGADNASYKCMSWGPDADGVNGVFLGKDVVSSAAAVITSVLKDTAPRVMTWSQYGEAGLNILQRKLGYQVKPYRPDWTKIADHFVLHAGGYAVLKGLQAGINLPSDKMLPSFAGLREYGNTSLAYIEACIGVKRGERVLQLGVGGGMKAGANVWRALRDLDQQHTAWDHLVGTPLTEADLPRGLDMGDIRDPELRQIAEDGEEKSRRAKEDPGPDADSLLI